jgi:hypothetical protein
LQDVGTPGFCGSALNGTLLSLSETWFSTFHEWTAALGDFLKLNLVCEIREEPSFHEVRSHVNLILAEWRPLRG